MTKESILDKLEVQSQGDYFRKDVLKAMDEWAEEMMYLNAKGIVNIIVESCGFPEYANAPLDIGEIREVVKFFTKQGALSFGKWVAKNKLFKMQGMWGRHGDPEFHPLRDEEVYNLFISDSQQ